MSALVCGKRSFFEEIPSPPASKRARCSSSSPTRGSPSRPGACSIAQSPSAHSSSSPFDRLTSVFPHMDKKLLERTLEECGNDLELAIKNLNVFRLKYDDNNVEGDASKKGVSIASGEESLSSEESPVFANLPKDGTEWVELFVKEMLSAANVDDARARAARALKVLEKYIHAHSGINTAQNLQEENAVLKGQLQTLLHENTILKRAVSIQHERQKEFEDKAQEFQHLKQLVSQYQEQLRTLEVNNYALAMHLKQAQQSTSMPDRFHPDLWLTEEPCMFCDRR